MRKMLIVLLLTSAAMCQKLEVKEATARHVALAWGGSAPLWTVERKSGSAAFQKLASANAATYDDTTIAADGTYTYRVRSGDAGAPSNEVTVGPSPAGVSRPAPLPKGANPDRFSTKSALTLDDNGDPAVAFLWLDPNNDNDYGDNQVRFVRWDRASYRWAETMKVATVGEISDRCEPISLSVDASNGSVALAYPKAGVNGVVIALSSDRGATWKETTIAGGTESQASATAIALRAGHLQAVANFDQAGPQFVEGDVADPSKWKSTPVPVLGREHVGTTQVALAYDAKGPLVAFYDHAKGDDENYLYGVWRPGTAKAQLALDTKGHPADPANVSLSYGGGRFGMLVAANLEPNNSDPGVWYISSADGATWSAPVKLPVDGPRTTNSPFDLSLDSRAHAAAVFGSNSGSAGPTCGAPEMSLSADGTSWKTCSFTGAAGLPTNAQPPTVRAHFANNDKLYVLWPLTEENRRGTGLMLWHQP